MLRLCAVAAFAAASVMADQYAGRTLYTMPQDKAASSVVYVPDQLWFKKTDKIIVTNASATACSLVLEYVE